MFFLIYQLEPKCFLGCNTWYVMIWKLDHSVITQITLLLLPGLKARETTVSCIFDNHCSKWNSLLLWDSVTSDVGSGAEKTGQNVLAGLSFFHSWWTIRKGLEFLSFCRKFAHQIHTKYTYIIGILVGLFPLILKDHVMIFFSFANACSS